VVGDIHQEGLEKSAIPMVYAPGTPDYRDYLVVRASGHRKSLLPAVRAQVEAVDKRLAIDQFEAASDVLSAHESQRKFSSRLLGIFALIALALAAIGIYGTVSHWINERTHEIGIRMALGAQKSDVLGLVMGQGMFLALIGVAIGIAASLALTRFLSSLLYGVQPTDPLTFTAVSLVLIGVALLACYVPALRATKVDPMVALRYE
jgi:putative ABC transport system permease protein